MNYYEMTTEQLETLKASIDDKIDSYIGMSFASSRSEYVTYEIDSVDTDEIVINANHDLNGLIRDYTVTISGGVDDDVEYNRYNADEEIIDGGYMSFDRLQKDVHYAVIEIYELYKDLETINNILDDRAEEEPEEEPEEPEEEPEEVSIADVLGFTGFDYDDAKAKLENDPELDDLFETTNNILSTLGTRAEEEKETEGEVDNLQKTMLRYNHSINNQDPKGVHTMNRINSYNAYTVDRDFRYIANALGFHGFAYDDEDYDFRTKLEQDEELGDLLEQFEDIESSQFLIYTYTKVKFYERHEYDILSYLKTYGYDDNDNLNSIEDIMCSRVVAYVTGVISEYVY